MSFTDAIEELIIARWAPDDWLTIDDVVNLALDAGITDARSTIQRTMQELRDRRILKFSYNRGNYQRLALAEENETSINGQLNDAIRLRNRRFAYRPRLQALVDARIGRLTASFNQQDDTSLRVIPEILAKLEIRNTEAVANVMTRLGQGQFRADLFSYWGGCAITGCKLRRILRASHIKP